MNSALAVLFVTLVQDSAPRVVTIDPGFEIAGHRLVDTLPAGRTPFVVVARDGRVRSFAPKSETPIAARGELTLPHARRSLLDLAVWNDKTYLIALTPDGTFAYALDGDGVVSKDGSTWISRAKFNLRLVAPTFSSFVQDVNRDGLGDVVVPTLAGVELWLCSRDAPSGVPTFRKAATVSVEIDRSATTQFENLSDELESELEIPGLDTADVNGDSRPDLVVAQGRRRAWHLQREDGSFPVTADVSVDLSLFRDTLPEAEIRLGGTLSGSDRAKLQSRDLDGDKIPDYVIGHGRKVWVFRGGNAGPQFTTPSAILKTAEDITALLVHPLDADARADLLLVKVQIPTLATLLRGLFGDWGVRVRVLGYRNIGEGKFEDRPTLSNDLELRLPSIVGLLKNPEKILERFEELQKRFRAGARGDIDGDGTEDVLLVSADEKVLEIWLQPSGDASTAGAGERKLRGLLFDDPGAVWDLDSVVGALGNFAERQVALATGSRASDRRVPLRDPSEAHLRSVESADFDGDGRAEIVLSYTRRNAASAGWFEVLVFDAKQ